MSLQGLTAASTWDDVEKWLGMTESSLSHVQLFFIYLFIFTFIHNRKRFFSAIFTYYFINRLFTPVKNDKISWKYTVCNSPKMAILFCRGFFVLPWIFILPWLFLFCHGFFILPRLFYFAVAILCYRGFCLAVAFCFVVAFWYCRDYFVLLWHLWATAVEPLKPLKLLSLYEYLNNL